MPEHPEAIIAGKNRPFTGAEFLESLRDGREVYIYGERVKDVTTHPAFRNSAASVALLYDALHAKETKDVLVALRPHPRGCARPSRLLRRSAPVRRGTSRPRSRAPPCRAGLR
jgi:hypothetical protein